MLKYDYTTQQVADISSDKKFWLVPQSLDSH